MNGPVAPPPRAIVGRGSELACFRTGSQDIECELVRIAAPFGGPSPWHSVCWISQEAANRWVRLPATGHSQRPSVNSRLSRFL